MGIYMQEDDGTMVVEPILDGMYEGVYIFYNLADGGFFFSYLVTISLKAP